jgi:hypothetical protein
VSERLCGERNRGERKKNGEAEKTGEASHGVT